MSDDPIAEQEADAPSSRPPSSAASSADPSVSGFVASYESFEWFSGPLPHPRILREYNEICPGAADRILGMAERQATQRQALERIVVEGKDRRATQGQRIGGALAALITVLAFILILTGRSI
ncbi:MAG: DUF2335 domain-containing protein [Acidimicrobiales bacterium]